MSSLLGLMIWVVVLSLNLSGFVVLLFPVFVLFGLRFEILGFG